MTTKQLRREISRATRVYINGIPVDSVCALYAINLHETLYGNIDVPAKVEMAGGERILRMGEQ